MSDTEPVRLEQRDHIVELILNRPHKRNAVNWPLIKALDACLDQAARLDGARVLLLRGEGKCFSSGIDLSAFFSMDQDFGPGWRSNLVPMTQTFQGVLTRLERSPLPSVALLHGVCLGLGLELALACDLRVAAEGTRIGLPETRLGLIPDVGGTTRLTRLAGPARAKEAILTGKELPPETWERWGVLNHVVAPDQLQHQGEALAAELAAAAPLAVAFAKQVIDSAADLDRGLQMEALAQSHLITTEDVMLGAQSMMTKQRPKWKGK